MALNLGMEVKWEVNRKLIYLSFLENHIPHNKDGGNILEHHIFSASVQNQEQIISLEKQLEILDMHLTWCLQPDNVPNYSCTRNDQELR